MTAALTGRPLLALLVACYVVLALLVLALCAASKRPEASALIDLRDGDRRRPGELPCPATGGSHIAVSTAAASAEWRNVCEKCGEGWLSWRETS